MDGFEKNILNFLYFVYCDENSFRVFIFVVFIIVGYLRNLLIMLLYSLFLFVYINVWLVDCLFIVE